MRGARMPSTLTPFPAGFTPRRGQGGSDGPGGSNRQEDPGGPPCPRGERPGGIFPCQATNSRNRKARNRRRFPAETRAYWTFHILQRYEGRKGGFRMTKKTAFWIFL